MCSGGYNIKIGAVTTIELMMKDMGGSAAVFGAAKALGQIKPPGVEVLPFSVTCVSKHWFTCYGVSTNNFPDHRFILFLLHAKI